jgi:hypothetical protein
MRFDPKDARETAWFLAISGYIPFLLLALGLIFVAETSPWHAGPYETAVCGDRSDRQEPGENFAL